MNINNVKEPKSSFLSVEKDAALILDRIASNQNLQKLLYYNTKDALSRHSLTEEQFQSLIENNIKFVPKIKADQLVETYLLINFDGFKETYNPEFRDNIIEFDIICHFDQWHLKDFELRPYRIAAEIDTMLQEKRLTGIGETEFLGANQMILSDEIAGICLMYGAIHGEEDKKFMPNPANEKQFIKDFNELYN